MHLAHTRGLQQPGDVDWADTAGREHWGRSLTKGSLVLNVEDSRTGREVYRSYVTAEVTAPTDGGRRDSGQIRRAVNKALADFPRAAAK